MNSPVYCVKCRKEIDPTWIHCPSCGANQQFTKQPDMQPQAEPVASPPVPPTYAPQQPLSANLVLDEMTRQYKNLTWMQFAGIFLLGAYLIGLVMIVYGMVQKPAFRRKVAELGYDPEAWERPLRNQATRLLIIGGVIYGVAAIISLVFFLVAYHSRPSGY